jgi:alkylhydroperoxidase family enzyme
MSVTPPRVTDELSERLLAQLGPAGMVELAATVGFANMTTRCNTAMGIESQGFSKACKVPLAQRSNGYATSG